MADVSRLTPSGRDRGQLILVAGLVVALGMVALVLLLNTAIYTEHLATEDSTPDGTDALAYRVAVADGVGGALVRENNAEYDDAANLRANVTNDTHRVLELLHRRGTESGVWQQGTGVRLSDGALLRQTDGSRELTSAPGSANWTLATDINDTRRFRVNVTGGLVDTVELNLEAYHVSVEGADGNAWRLYVYKDGTTTKLGVKNGSDSSPTMDVCTPSEKPSIDITGGTVDGTKCSAIQYAKGVSPPYTIEYVRGDRAKGRYNLTVNTTGDATVNAGNFNGTDGPSPYQVPAVYDVRLVVEYDAPGIRYEAPLRVAPGEPDE